jgi:hypothetical protein
MIGNSKQYFVFVVCGSKEHIDTLHFSIKALQKFSSHEAFVITDSNRNETPIEYVNVIDIKTPAHYTHHQSSIYLKTCIHRCLPKGNLYCYLDTDVVALSKEVDSIFNHFHSPITFCTDHCKLDEFSPSAIHCGCLEKYEKGNKKLSFYMNEYEKSISQELIKKNQYILKSIEEIDKLISLSKQNKWVYFCHKLKYAIGGKYYHLNKKYKLNKATKEWYDANDLVLKMDANNFTKYVEQQTGFTFSIQNNEWYGDGGFSFSKLKCNHLIEQLNSDFNLKINHYNWQHWNGGVFLFNDESEHLLEEWHQATIDIFDNKKWKTRDQGTLAYTAWKNKLQMHKTIPIEYNFIADYNSQTTVYLGNLNFSFIQKSKIVMPFFIHIYHHWGDEKWKVWQDVKNRIVQL